VPPVALYVHVPFCLSVCPYCDFVVYGGRQARGEGNRLGAFSRALEGELELRADALDDRFGTARPALRSMYLGGGTPSLLPVGQIERLIERVRLRYRLTVDAEITLEANPGPTELGDLHGFRSAGVNRLSIGAQSLQPSELRRLGRRHESEDVIRAVDAAAAAGFENISIDLLYDIPGQTLESWSDTLDVAARLPLSHVSAYALALDDPDGEGLTAPTGDHLPVRPGAARWRERAVPGQDADRAAEMYSLADERLGNAGLNWYELSNWALPGFESRHNLVYWRRHPYEALGPGAHAFDGGQVRRWNAARLDAYLEALRPADHSAPRLPPGGAEQLDATAVAAEERILALRLAEGISTQDALDGRVGPALTWAAGQGLLEPEADRLRLSLRGRLLSNEVFLRLL